MPRLYFACCALFFSVYLFSQDKPDYPFEPSPEHPFGLPNPEAPKEIRDFALLIGECDCESISRKPDQSWAEPIDMLWRFKYIMNGMAVQDETLKADGRHTGSIRQFDAQSGQWLVHFYAGGSISNPLMTWEGKKNEKGEIVLYRDNPSPQGAPGFYKISFYDIKETGFRWLGEWVNPDESIHYPLWKINCVKR